MRDNKGRFGSGNTFGKGRPKGSGKKHVKEMTWGALERVVKLLFTMSDKDFAKWMKENGHTLSRAEKIFLKNENVDNLKHLNGLVDRVCGKPAIAQDDLQDDDDELAEALEILELEESGGDQKDQKPRSGNTKKKKPRRRKPRAKKAVKKDSK